MQRLQQQVKPSTSNHGTHLHQMKSKGSLNSGDIIISFDVSKKKQALRSAHPARHKKADTALKRNSSEEMKGVGELSSKGALGHLEGN